MSVRIEVVYVTGIDACWSHVGVSDCVLSVVGMCRPDFVSGGV